MKVRICRLIVTLKVDGDTPALAPTVQRFFRTFSGKREQHMATWLSMAKHLLLVAACGVLLIVVVYLQAVTFSQGYKRFEGETNEQRAQRIMSSAVMLRRH